MQYRFLVRGRYLVRYRHSRQLWTNYDFKGRRNYLNAALFKPFSKNLERNLLWTSFGLLCLLSTTYMIRSAEDRSKSKVDSPNNKFEQDQESTLKSLAHNKEFVEKKGQSKINAHISDSEFNINHEDVSMNIINEMNYLIKLNNEWEKLKFEYSKKNKIKKEIPNSASISGEKLETLSTKLDENLTIVDKIYEPKVELPEQDSVYQNQAKKNKDFDDKKMLNEPKFLSLDDKLTNYIELKDAENEQAENEDESIEKKGLVETQQIVEVMDKTEDIAKENKQEDGIKVVTVDEKVFNQLEPDERHENKNTEQSISDNTVDVSKNDNENVVKKKSEVPIDNTFANKQSNYKELENINKEFKHTAYEKSNHIVKPDISQNDKIIINAYKNVEKMIENLPNQSKSSVSIDGKSDINLMNDQSKISRKSNLLPVIGEENKTSLENEQNKELRSGHKEGRAKLGNVTGELIDGSNRRQNKETYVNEYTKNIKPLNEKLNLEKSDLDFAMNPEELSEQGVYNPNTGEVNWDCPTLAGLAHGPCGLKFRSTFLCFLYSDNIPKGKECLEQFHFMQKCFQTNSNYYFSKDDEL